MMIFLFDHFNQWMSIGNFFSTFFISAIDHHFSVQFNLKPNLWVEHLRTGAGNMFATRGDQK